MSGNILPGDGKHIFAAWDVQRWAKEHGGRAPSFDELQAPPFNFTESYAAEFLDYAKKRGWMREASETKGGAAG